MKSNVEDHVNIFPCCWWPFFPFLKWISLFFDFGVEQFYVIFHCRILVKSLVLINLAKVRQDVQGSCLKKIALIFRRQFSTRIIYCCYILFQIQIKMCLDFLQNLLKIFFLSGIHTWATKYYDSKKMNKKEQFILLLLGLVQSSCNYIQEKKPKISRRRAPFTNISSHSWLWSETYGQGRHWDKEQHHHTLSLFTSLLTCKQTM